MDVEKDRIPVIQREFAQHVATYEEVRVGLETLLWRNPTSSNYLIHYLRHQNNLFISGDCGEAVFQWSSPVCLEGIRNLNLDYFASKCCASEEGSRWREWSAPLAREALQDYFKERELDFISGHCDANSEKFRGKTEQEIWDWLQTEECAGSPLQKMMRQKRTAFEESTGSDCLCSKEDWVEWAQEEGARFFGSDYYEWLYDIGNVIPWRMQAWLEGLRLAFIQLKGN